ncbi:MAG: hypothetical protein H7099_14830 [Gemmatimonadaceae bacterium]|nr:hypothetical protein [Gemmatimonadaceae bacterium]
MKRLHVFSALVPMLLLHAACAREPQRKTDTTSVAAASAPTPLRATLLDDLGRYHRDIRTASREAQQFFDEGLTLLYGFNHAEAFTSFARAAALDDASPMPHWGMSLALGTNINDAAPAERVAKAYTHLVDAMTRLTNGAAVEQGLVAALARRYVAEPTGDQAVRERAYSDAMRALAQRFPDDADVAALYAESLMNLHPWRLYRADGSPESWTPAIVATLERVLSIAPNHPGANHYYIHAVEASRTPQRAVRSASLLETLVPGAGHLVHMPAHIYIRTGRYTQAARSNAAAAAVDEKYFRTPNPQTFYAMAYYGHNLQFESAAAMYAGNFAEARAAARRTAALAEPGADQMAMLEPFAAQELLVLVRFGAWAEVLTQRAPKASRTIQRGLYHWSRGAAFAHTRRPADARVQLDSLTHARARVPADAMVGPVNNGGDVLAVADADLRGRIAFAIGDTNGAIAAFTAAVAAEDRLGYNEPPDWLLPERERLGAVLLVARRFREAETVFRQDLQHNIGNPRALFGLWRSLESQRQVASAADAKRAFEEAWRGADIAPETDPLPKR